MNKDEILSYLNTILNQANDNFTFGIDKEIPALTRGLGELGQQVGRGEFNPSEIQDAWNTEREQQYKDYNQSSLDNPKTSAYTNAAIAGAELPFAVPALKELASKGASAMKEPVGDLLDNLHTQIGGKSFAVPPVKEMPANYSTDDQMDSLLKVMRNITNKKNVDTRPADDQLQSFTDYQNQGYNMARDMIDSPEGRKALAHHGARGQRGYHSVPGAEITPKDSSHMINKVRGNIEDVQQGIAPVESFNNSVGYAMGDATTSLDKMIEALEPSLTKSDMFTYISRKDKQYTNPAYRGHNESYVDNPDDLKSASVFDRDDLSMLDMFQGSVKADDIDRVYRLPPNTPYYNPMGTADLGEMVLTDEVLRGLPSAPRGKYIESLKAGKPILGVGAVPLSGLGSQQEQLTAEELQNYLDNL